MLMLSLSNVLQTLGQGYSDISVTYSYLHQGAMSEHALMVAWYLYATKRWNFSCPVTSV